jgi:hypothetical protein
VSIAESNVMRRTLLAILLLTATTASADPALQGVWEIASTSYDDEAVTLREPRQIKIFTLERVIYTYYYEVSEQQPHYLSVGHGTYSYADGILRETIVNHSNPDLIGQIFEVTVSVREDANSFTQIVDLGKYVLRETWTRVE